jgi:hypothetical protein
MVGRAGLKKGGAMHPEYAATVILLILNEGRYFDSLGLD